MCNRHGLLSIEYAIGIAYFVGLSLKLDDQQLRLKINQRLIETGEKERFVH